MHRFTCSLQRAATAMAACTLFAGLPAQAAPMTLHINGLYTATNSQATVNSAAANALAQSVNGTNSWNQLRDISISLALDFDDTLTQTHPSSNVWNWSYDSVSALRIQLGNAHFATEAAAGTSLGSVRVGATATDTAPALTADLLLNLSQPWSRSGSPQAYSFAGATPQVSGGGLYEHYFRTAFDQHTGNRVIDFWGILASTDGLSGGTPTGRWRLTDFEVTPLDTGPVSSVPEPSVLSLLVLGLAALMTLRRR